MKRLMVLVAMMALMLAAAAPAFAQTNIDVSEQGDTVEFNGVGQNIIGSVNTGDNTATANATATSTATADAGDDAVAVADGDATADIFQDSGVSISQSNVVGNSFFVHHLVFFF